MEQNIYDDLIDYARQGMESKEKTIELKIAQSDEDDDIYPIKNNWKMTYKNSCSLIPVLKQYNIPIQKTNMNNTIQITINEEEYYLGLTNKKLRLVGNRQAITINKKVLKDMILKNESMFSHYTFKFGKYKDKKLSEFESEEEINYLKWYIRANWQQYQNRTDNPFSKDIKLFKSYLKEKVGFW